MLKPRSSSSSTDFIGGALHNSSVLRAVLLHEDWPKLWIVRTRKVVRLRRAGTAVGGSSRSGFDLQERLARIIVGCPRW